MREPRRGEWRTGAGEFIRIRKMRDSHLANAIRVMERSAPGYALSMALSAGHYASQHDSMGGEAADEAADELIDMALDEPSECASQLWPKYDELIRERERRDRRAGRSRDG